MEFAEPYVQQGSQDRDRSKGSPAEDATANLSILSRGAVHPHSLSRCCPASSSPFEGGH
jgi:hypothetical protein